MGVSCTYVQDTRSQSPLRVRRFRSVNRIAPLCDDGGYSDASRPSSAGRLMSHPFPAVISHGDAIANSNHGNVLAHHGKDGHEIELAGTSSDRPFQPSAHVLQAKHVAVVSVETPSGDSIPILGNDTQAQGRYADTASCSEAMYPCSCMPSCAYRRHADLLVTFACMHTCMHYNAQGSSFLRGSWCSLFTFTSTAMLVLFTKCCHVWQRFKTLDVVNPSCSSKWNLEVCSIGACILHIQTYIETL